MVLASSKTMNIILLYRIILNQLFTHQGKIPLELHPKLEKELDEMVEPGIITPVNGPST